MTPRQRILTALAHERPDALPCHESPWEGVVELWREQGLPPDVDPADHFGWDLAMMGLDTSPRFEQRVIEEKDGYVVYEDRFGYRAQKEAGRGGLVHFTDHRAADDADWPAVRARLVMTADEPARIDDASYFGHFDPYPTWEQARARYDRIRATERFLLFNVYGPKEATWRFRGYEQQLFDLAADRDLARDMAQAHTDLTLQVLRACLDRGMKPDGIFMVDDLAWRQALLCSPEAWRSVYRPSVERIGAFLAEHGISFWYHTDGAVHALIDDLIDCGVAALQPLEVKAGMDANDLRHRYGKRLCLFGNIDVQAMTASDEAVEREITAKVPLARNGGYIFHSDHSVPPDVSFDQYSRILARAREVFREDDS